MFDRADGRLVFTALSRRVEAALGAATGGRWGCRRAVPRIDGSLYFELVRGGNSCRLDWLGPGRLELSIPEDSGPVVEVVGRTLAELLSSDDFFLLRHHNQDIQSLRFDDDVVDLLLAGRFEPGRTSWFGYRFVDSFQEASEAFYVTFHGPRGPVVFRIRSAAAADPSGGERVFANHLFEIRLLDDRRDPGSRRLLSHQVERFLGFLLNRAVHPRMVLEDQASGARSGPGEMPDVPFDGSGDAGFDRGSVSTSQWGSPRQWYQFFSDFEIERSNLCSLTFSDPVRRITHGEPECMNIEPRVSGGTVMYANLPWSPEGREETSGSGEIFTRLGEEDLVLGGMQKLEQALAAATSDRDALMVCVNDTCLPKIIGDDVRSAAARFQRSSGLPVCYLNTDLGSPSASFVNLVEQVRQRVGPVPDSAGGKGLNLIGFHPGRGRDEILAELEQSSIPVNVCLMPEFGVRSLEKYREGAVGVVYPYSLWVDLAENVLKDFQVPRKVLPAPYGVRRTREWFRAVAEALDIPGAYASWESRWLEPALGHWSPLLEEAGRYDLAVVVEEESLSRLVDSGRHYGFELLPLLEDMGFGLHVLVKQRAAGASLDAGVLTGALQGPERHTFTGFTSQAELEDLLREGSFSAVYSEVFFDTRITRAGKAAFNLSMIEMGLRGAIRSLQRLLNVCAWPFYRRYRRYLMAESEPERG